jgi:hypothetical protein
MIGADEPAVCAQCHEKGSRGSEAASELRRDLDGFESGFQAVTDLLARAKQKGVDVGAAEYKLLDVTTVLVTAKNLTHNLDTAGIAKTVAEGETALAGVRAAGEKALDEARFRRRGLGVTTVLLALLAAALALKVKRMSRDRRIREGSGDSKT